MEKKSSLLTFVMIWVAEVSGNGQFVMEVSMIQGHPCADQIETKLLSETYSSFPQECDQFCSETPDCASFTWDRTNSTCKFYSQCAHGRISLCCYEASIHTFWFLKQFLTNRASFPKTEFATLTAANKYIQPPQNYQLETLSASEGTPLDCVRAEERGIFEKAYGVCLEMNQFLFEPENRREIDTIRNSVLFWDRVFLTGYVLSVMHNDTFGGYESKYRFILQSNEMFGITYFSPKRSCIAFDYERSGLKNAACDRTRHIICCSNVPLNFCEKTFLVPSKNGLIQPGFFFSEEAYYLSTTACSAKLGTAASLSEIRTWNSDGSGGLPWQTGQLLNASMAVNPSGLYNETLEVHLKLANQKCLHLVEGEIAADVDRNSCETDANSLMLCSTKYFSSGKLVMYSDAQQFCRLFGADLISKTDLDTDHVLAHFIQTMSCDRNWVKVAGDEDFAYKVDANGNRLKTKLPELEVVQNTTFNYAVCKVRGNP